MKEQIFIEIVKHVLAEFAEVRIFCTSHLDALSVTFLYGNIVSY